MMKMPEFTERAAHEIRRLNAELAADLPPGKYINCVGWEVGFDESFQARPAIGMHEIDKVPESLIVECHGLRLAYNLPDDVMAALRSSVLDFNGRDFAFVDRVKASKS